MVSRGKKLGNKSTVSFFSSLGRKKGEGGENRDEKSQSVCTSLQENLINAIQGDNSVLFGEIPLNCPIKLVRAESSKTGK